MSAEIATASPRGLLRIGLPVLPAVIAVRATARAAASSSSSPPTSGIGTRTAYARVLGPFLAWCEER